MRAAQAALAAIFFLLLASCQSAPTQEAHGGSPAYPTSSTSPLVIFPDGHRVDVSLATDPETQARGLMFVEHLPDDQGMLFLFQEDSRRTFWMKNCKMPIDMIWLDAFNKIVDITDSAPPCQNDPCPQYGPKVECRNVLEVRGGLSRDHALRVGDTLVIVK